MKHAKRKPRALESQECQKGKQMTAFWIEQEGSKCCYHFTRTIWHIVFFWYTRFLEHIRSISELLCLASEQQNLQCRNKQL